MEDNLNILTNERRPQLFWPMEDDLHILADGRRHQNFGKLKTALNILSNKRQLFFFKWKTTPNLL
jgi:hypothetical protein